MVIKTFAGISVLYALVCYWLGIGNLWGSVIPNSFLRGLVFFAPLLFMLWAYVKELEEVREAGRAEYRGRWEQALADQENSKTNPS